MPCSGGWGVVVNLGLSWGGRGVEFGIGGWRGGVRVGGGNWRSW